jgi:hypothetical protein
MAQLHARSNTALNSPACPKAQKPTALRKEQVSWVETVMSKGVSLSFWRATGRSLWRHRKLVLMQLESSTLR